MNPRRLALSALFSACTLAWPADLVLKNAPVQIYFSPRGGCTAAVVAALRSARRSVLVQAYSFTSAPIAGALKEAHDRGLEVRVILDKSQRTEHYSSSTFLQHAGVPTWIDSAHAIAHNKVMVLDGETVITGSFNFTKGAEDRNAENLLIIRDPELASRYAENWESHRKHSEPMS
ncbi:MAG: phospholipase D family protein [Holophaga sp.]|nr:phospholipase D family protein [Holophaga sp.]